MIVDGELVEVVDVGDGWRRSLRPHAAILAGAATEGGAHVDGVLTAPLRPGNVIGVGLNFADMVAEMGAARPERPYLFPKFGSSVIGPDAPIVVDPSVTTRVDWEGELAVVIGRTASRVSPAYALQHVFGYTVANDVSARDLQAADGQWVRGKAMDTFCPLGPWIVDAAALPDPQALRIRTTVDDVVVQDGTTAAMIFSIAELVADISSWVTLQPGDVVLTGTPSGCGEWQNPPQHLHPGSTVSVEIDGIGRLTNPVTREPLPRSPALQPATAHSQEEA